MVNNHVIHTVNNKYTQTKTEKHINRVFVNMISNIMGRQAGLCQGNSICFRKIRLNTEFGKQNYGEINQKVSEICYLIRINQKY